MWPTGSPAAHQQPRRPPGAGSARTHARPVRRRRARGEPPGRADDGTGSTTATGRRPRWRDRRRARRGTGRRASGPSARTGRRASQDRRLLVAEQHACRAGPGNGHSRTGKTGARGTPSRRATQRQAKHTASAAGRARSRRGRPRLRAGGDAVAGSALVEVADSSGSGRCRRKVPVARLTSAPSASRTVASP